MAWEWVSPTATAAMGIATVTVSYAISRSTSEAVRKVAADQHDHERSQLVRRERLDAYASYLSTMDEFNRALDQVSQPIGHLAAAIAAKNVYETLVRQYCDVIILGSDEVQEAAAKTQAEAIKALTTSLESSEIQTISGEALGLIVVAMRTDARRGIKTQATF